MKDEVTQLQQAVEAVVRILKKDAALDKKEEWAIASEIGRVRSELGLWRKRKKPR